MIKKIGMSLFPTTVLLVMSACSGDSGTNVASHNPAFITTWETNKPGGTGDDQVSISTGGKVGNYTINWGDGVIENNQTADVIHTYGSAGIYTIQITGDFPAFTGSNNAGKLLSVDNWGGIKWTTMTSAFANCTNLTITAKDAPDLSNVTDMSWMFHGAKAFNQDISHWDTSKVKNMEGMFKLAGAFNQPLGNWNTSSVTDMTSMFAYADSFNQSLDSWDTSSVTTMQQMFQNSNYTQPLNSWETSSVTNMRNMFSSLESFNSPFNSVIGDWNTSKVIDMNGMFLNSNAFNQPLGDWNTSSVTNMGYMFYGATAFSNQDLSGWTVSKVVDYTDFFAQGSENNGNTEPIWPIVVP